MSQRSRAAQTRHAPPRLGGSFARGLAAVGWLVSSSACGQARQEVVPYTSVDQVFSEPIFRAFEEPAGIPVRAVFDTEETKSTGVLNRIIAEAGAPQADVFWSGDPARAFVLVDRGLVEPYERTSSPCFARCSPKRERRRCTSRTIYARLLPSTHASPCSSADASSPAARRPSWRMRRPRRSYERCSVRAT